MSDAGEKYCQGLLKNNEACTCKVFMKPIDNNAPLCCRGCQHGFSKHPQQAKPGGGSSSSVKVKLEDGRGTWKFLDAFCNQKTAILPPLDIQQACEEVLKGYHTGQSSTQGRITPNKTKVHHINYFPYVHVLIHWYYRNLASLGSHSSFYLRSILSWKFKWENGLFWSMLWMKYVLCNRPC